MSHTPRTWSDGDQVTAAALNTDVKDVLVSLDTKVDEKPFVHLDVRNTFYDDEVINAATAGVWGQPFRSARNSHPCLNFDPLRDATVIWSTVLSPDYSGNGLVVSLYWTPEVARGKRVVWGIEFESHTPDVDDLDSDSWGTGTNTVAEAPREGILSKVDIVLSDGAAIGSVAAGESFRLRVTRVASDASDDMEGMAQLFRATVREP